MSRTKVTLCIVCLLQIPLLYADSGPSYLLKFKTYLDWSQHLPIKPNPAFLTFVSQTSPLSQKLRERWLYEVARTKDWTTYTKYYQPSEDRSLQCYAQMALLEQGLRQEIIPSLNQLWLTTSPDPTPCSRLFSRLMNEGIIDEALLTKRLILALDQHLLPLATNLLKQYSPPRFDEVSTLLLIHKNPSQITALTPTTRHQEFYLYGLKRMIASHINEAIQLFQETKTKQFLDNTQKQRFLVQIALYKAMRNQPDATLWFQKVNPAFYTDSLLEWEIRYALNQRQWAKVEQLIQKLHDQENPCWHYWLARSLDEQGKHTAATTIYQSIASTRNYYGFLASRRLNKTLSFESEETLQNPRLLSAYLPLIEQIKALYRSNQTGQASRLLNDFSSELPKDEKIALAQWVATELKWYGKSISFSNTDELNNQLSLRFPLAYQRLILTFSKIYQVPQALIYAIIRQESAFREDATSSAGAKGLMQLMPATAHVVSKQNRIHYASHQQLFSAQNNIELGAAYLKGLSKHYHHHPLLMAAAYNAGPKQVANWLKNTPPKDIDIWIETLPWPETRNYLKNIIAFYAVYQYRLSEKPNLSPFMRDI